MPAARTLQPTVPVNRPAARIQDSLLASGERRVLAWLARRLPDRVNPDHLTTLALVAMLGGGAAYGLGGRAPWALGAATAMLFVNWFGDSLDGTLARLRNCQRPRYGYYVDHVCDAVGTAALVGGLAVSGLMQPAIAGVLLITYYLLSIEVYLAAHSVGRFQMSFFGVGPTELRLLLAAGNVALMANPDAGVAGTRLGLFDVGGLVGSAGLAATFVWSAVRHTRQLYREETR